MTSKLCQKVLIVPQVGVEEALHFQETQELPEGFIEAMDEGDEAPMLQAPAPISKDLSKAPRSASAKGQPRDKLGQAGRGKGGKRGSNAHLAELLGPGNAPISKQKIIKDRQARILQSLALSAPPDSPFADCMCLSGIQALVGVL